VKPEAGLPASMYSEYCLAIGPRDHAFVDLTSRVAMKLLHDGNQRPEGENFVDIGFFSFCLQKND
jgi:hypothetical protein